MSSFWATDLFTNALFTKFQTKFLVCLHGEQQSKCKFVEISKFSNEHMQFKTSIQEHRGQTFAHARVVRRRSRRTSTDDGKKNINKITRG